MNVQIKVKPGVPHKLDPGDNPTYEEWFERVTRLMLRGAGIHPLDLPDCTWRAWHDARVRPIRAANKALRHAQE